MAAPSTSASAPAPASSAFPLAAAARFPRVSSASASSSSSTRALALAERRRLSEVGGGDRSVAAGRRSFHGLVPAHALSAGDDGAEGSMQSLRWELSSRVHRSHEKFVASAHVFAKKGLATKGMDITPAPASSAFPLAAAAARFPRASSSTRALALALAERRRLSEVGGGDRSVATGRRTFHSLIPAHVLSAGDDAEGAVCALFFS
uniref:Uncharacterized protein n=1 Tax=Oryza meridionalis TaxID=40149 RepID=A0A0E0EKM0_9ORYZ